jgi:hypothetical protein
MREEYAMPLLPPMKDVPPGEVGNVVQSFIENDGVNRLEINRQPDGNFTVAPKAETGNTRSRKKQ